MEERKGNIIYRFLEKLNVDSHVSLSELGDIDPDADNDPEILDYIKENDLIRSRTGHFTYEAIVYITSRGKDVLNHDSWNDYINFRIGKENSKALIENERQDKKDKILDLDLKLKSFEKKQGNKFKQWSFFILVINLIIVVGGVVTGYLLSNKKVSQDIDQQERIEKKLNKLEDQILMLERKHDSTNRPKI